MKRFKRAVARNSLFTCSWLFNRLPYNAVRALTNIFVWLGYQITIKQKQLAKESLEMAFGQEKSKDEIAAISKKCFDNLGRGMIELIYFMDHPAMIKSQVVIEGKEHLDAAMKHGKGVIGVSAHFGSFPLMLLHLAQLGYKTNAIIRPARDEIIEKHFLSLRSRLGLHTVYAQPRHACVTESIKLLRNNEFLFIPLDQNFGRAGGVFVDFFGQKAATATGPVIFAQRTGALILPMFIIRQNDDVHKIIIEPPFEIEPKADDKETIQFNVARITAIIEQYIRKYPAEWGWMHRRWKSRPKHEETAVSEEADV
jgi:Kdo2-lipid IVA lauroyltransferase/acyltransferase